MQGREAVYSSQPQNLFTKFEIGQKRASLPHVRHAPAIEHHGAVCKREYEIQMVLMIKIEIRCAVVRRTCIPLPPWLGSSSKGHPQQICNIPTARRWLPSAVSARELIGARVELVADLRKVVIDALRSQRTPALPRQPAEPQILRYAQADK